MPGKGLRRTPSIHDHKYSRGVVAIIAGSRLYPGAGVLTVGGARLGGAGYVKFLDSNARVTDLVLNAFPDVVPIKTLTNQVANQISSQKVDALVVGPGSTTIRTLPDSIPVVLDSGALSLARSSRGKRSADQIIVVTPHEGELKSLGYSIVSGERKKTAERIADELNVICVLKGHRTVIAAPSSPAIVNTNGGPELATAGSGDILAGLIGAFLASWKPKNFGEAQKVIRDAVHLHSAAGAHAAHRKKTVVATDILESLSYC
jgi:hydroxyethylthiazole kinase-like uncharacterized protein yjeF